MAEEFYEGVEIEIRGKKYIVPGLSLGQLENNAEDIQTVLAMTNQNDMRALGTIAKIVHLAFSRNYPDITLDQIKEMIDMRNMNRIIGAVMNSTGFSSGAANAGEQMPVARKSKK